MRRREAVQQVPGWRVQVMYGLAAHPLRSKDPRDVYVQTFSTPYKIAFGTKKQAEALAVEMTHRVTSVNLDVFNVVATASPVMCGVDLEGDLVTWSADHQRDRFERPYGEQVIHPVLEGRVVHSVADTREALQQMGFYSRSDPATVS